MPGEKINLLSGNSEAFVRGVGPTLRGLRKSNTIHTRENHVHEEEEHNHSHEERDGEVKVRLGWETLQGHWEGLRGKGREIWSVWDIAALASHSDGLEKVRCVE